MKRVLETKSIKQDIREYFQDSGDSLLLEMFDKRIKRVAISKEGDDHFYRFTIEANSPANPNEEDIIYSVVFHRPGKRTITGLEVGEGMTILSSTLTFSNNLTSMSTLQSRGYKDVNQNLVLSTIAAIVIRHFELTSKIQAIDFTVAHQGLHKAYKILSREAERKGPLKWANPSRDPSTYYIVRKEIWEQYLKVIGEK